MSSLLERAKNPFTQKQTRQNGSLWNKITFFNYAWYFIGYTTTCNGFHYIFCENCLKFRFTLKKCLHLSFLLATASGISCDYNCSSSWQIMTSARNPNSGEILASSFLIGKEISDVGNGKLTSSWPVLDHCHPSLSSNSTSLVIDKFSSIASSLSSSDAGCSLPAEHMKTLGRRCSTAVLVSCLLEMKSLLVSVLFVRRVSRAFGEPAGAVLVLWNLCNSKAVQNLADWTAETDLRWVLGISDRVVNWGREEELWAVRHSNSIFSCDSF